MPASPTRLPAVEPPPLTLTAPPLLVAPHPISRQDTAAPVGTTADQVVTRPFGIRFSGS
jgi:hypothetical protein